MSTWKLAKHLKQHQNLAVILGQLIYSKNSFIVLIPGEGISPAGEKKKTGSQRQQDQGPIPLNSFTDNSYIWKSIQISAFIQKLKVPNWSLAILH